MRRVSRKVREIIEAIESKSVTLAGWIYAFFGVVLVRVFLENISNTIWSGLFTVSALTLIHYGLFFFVALFSIMLVRSAFIGSVRGELPLALFGLCAIWIPPLVDMLIAGGANLNNIHYLALPPRDLFAAPVKIFFSDIPGASAGIKTELVVLLLGMFAYVLQKTKNIPKGIVAALLCYLIIFLLGSMPSVVWLLHSAYDSPSVSSASISSFFTASGNESLMAKNFLSPVEKYAPLRAADILFDATMARIFYILAVALCALWACTRIPRIFRAATAHIRPSHGIHYFALLLGGVLAARALFHPPVAYNWIDAMDVIVLFLTFLFARMYAVGADDIADRDIDSVIHKERPLVSGGINERELKDLCLFFLVAAALGAFISSPYTFLFVLCYLGLARVYSFHPLRLKRFPILSTFLIALASLCTFFSGFFLMSPVKSVTAIPFAYSALIVVSLTFAATAKDIKDAEGDRAGGVYTIPVLFGRNAGNTIVGYLLFLSFLCFPVFLGSWALFVPALLGGALAYWIATRKQFREKLLLVAYIVFLCAAFFLYKPL